MSNAEKSNTTIIIVAIIVVFLCCVISGVLMFLLFRTPADPKIAPGLIGGPCNKGNCSAPNSICKFDMCYEQCKGRNAWPCDSDGDVQYAKKYWCDYSNCPEWVPPKAANAEEKKGSTFFEDAVKQQQDIDAKKAAIAAEQQTFALEQKKAAAAASVQAEAQIKELCKCNPVANIHSVCATGPYYDDGGFAQAWCYVKGGTQCKTATPSTNSALKGSAWRTCDPNVDK